MEAAETITSDVSEESYYSPPQQAPAPKPNSGVMVRPIAVQAQKPAMPELTLDNAYKTIQFFQDEPQWLANHRTTHAANAILGQASKIISLNMQLEQAGAQGEAKRIRTGFLKQKFSDLSRVTPLIPSGDVEGQKELGRLNGMIDTPEFSLQEFSTGVAALQSKYTKPELPLGPIGKDLHDELAFYRQGGTRDQWNEAVKAHAKTTGEYAGPYVEPVIKDIGGKPFMFYRDFSPKPLDHLNPQQAQMVSVNSAALKQARRQIVAATDDATRDAAQKVYDRELQTFNEMFDIISPKAAPSPATNAPAASTPEKVRVKGPNGQTGTVPKGASLPEGWTLE